MKMTGAGGDGVEVRDDPVDFPWGIGAFAEFLLDVDDEDGGGHRLNLPL
jgi:hypothetical protein